MIVFSLFGYGQVPDSLIYSDLFEFDRKEFACSVINGTENTVAVVQDNEFSTVKIKVWPKFADPSESKSYTWTKEGERFMDLEIHYIEEWNGEILLLSKSKNSDRSKEHLWITRLTMEGKELITSLLFEKPYVRRNQKETYEVFKSQNDLVLGISRVFDDTDNDEFDIEIFLFDQRMNSLLDKSLSLQNIKKVNYPNLFQVSDEGVVYFLNGLTDEKNIDPHTIGLEKRLYQLFRYDFKVDKFKQYDVSIADKYISDVKMKLNPQGRAFVLGFYNDSFYKGTEGIFLMVIDEDDGSIIKSGKKDLDLKIKKDFLTDKKLRKSKSINDLFLDYVHFHENGNIVLFSEVYFVEQRVITSANGMNITTSNNFNFKEILVLELDQSLNCVQHNTIYKKQKSMNSFDSSWSYSIVDHKDSGALGVLFNYMDTKHEKGGAVVTSTARTYTWYQSAFGKDKLKLEDSKKRRVNPLYNPVFTGETAVLQGVNGYRFVNLNFSN